MTRTYDDRPVWGDDGMPDPGPQPAMSRFGQWIRRELLEHMNTPYRCNWANDTITVLASRDFVTVTSHLASQLGRPVEYVAGEHELTMSLTHPEAGAITLRAAEEVADALIAGGLVRSPDGYRLEGELDWATVREVLTAADPELAD